MVVQLAVGFVVQREAWMVELMESELADSLEIEKALMMVVEFKFRLVGLSVE